MNTILKNILRFTGLVVGVPVVQPHNLNLSTSGILVPLLPQFVATNAGGFTVAITNLTVTVTRTVDAVTGTVLVYVEHWHTIEEVLPPGNLVTLVPFLIQPGTGGGGGGVDTDGVTIGGDGTPGNALFVIPSGLDEQVTVAVDGVTITGDGTTANPLVAVAGTAAILVEDEGAPVVGGPFTTLDFVGEGVVASNGGGGTATVTIPRTVAVDGVTITGDGSTGNPLVAVAPVDTGITELTQDVLAGPGSGSQVATVVGLQSNPVAAGLPVAGDLLTWSGAQWAPSAPGLTPTTHETLRQLIHFLDDGPGAGFLSGANKITGYSGALVTSEVWYEDGTLTTRYVDLAVTYVGALPSVEVWRIYATDGVTVTATLTDVIAYAGALETQRTRTWI